MVHLGRQQLAPRFPNREPAPNATTQGGTLHPDENVGERRPNHIVCDVRDSSVDVAMAGRADRPDPRHHVRLLSED